MVSGVNLKEFMARNRTLTLDQRRKILKALLMGVRDINKENIVHRDIKLQNIVVTDDL